jgi:3-keto-5-aminohexanoate cleavage enzyme
VAAVASARSILLGNGEKRRQEEVRGSMPVWIEAALNGPWTQARQKLIPISVDDVVADGIACANAGAAVIHLHAYDAQTGQQNDDPETYAAIIEGIRAAVDAIVYPSIPFARSADAFLPQAATERYAAVEQLARRGLLEWAVVDPGSTNLAAFADVSKGRDGSVYLNPGEHVRRGLDLAARYGFAPSYAIYEPGFLRLGAALARNVAKCPKPIYRFMFSDSFTFGFAPDAFALDAYVQLLAQCAPDHQWMIAGLGVDIRPLIPHAVARGGHVRVGLEDAPFGSEWTNVQWVEDAVSIVQSLGERPAKAAEIRQALAAAEPPLKALAD